MKAMKKLGALVLSLAMAITLVVVPGGCAKAADTYHMFVGLGGNFEGGNWDAAASNSAEADAAIGDTVTIGLTFDSPVVYTYWVAPTIVMSSDDDITSIDYTIDSIKVDGEDVTSKLDSSQGAYALDGKYDIESTTDAAGTDYASTLRLDGSYNEWGYKSLPINDISTSYTSIEYTITINSINGVTASEKSDSSSSSGTTTILAPVTHEYEGGQVIDGSSGWNTYDGDNYLISTTPVTVAFTNTPFIRDSDNWSNFIVETVSSTEADGITLRADAYGWTYGDGINTPTYAVTTSWGDDWDSFVSICKANTDVTITAIQTSDSDVTFTIVWGEDVATEVFTVTYPNGVPSELYFHVGADGASITVNSWTSYEYIEVENETTEEETTEEEPAEEETPEEEISDEVTVDGITYQILSAEKKTAKVVDGSAASGKVKVSKTVTINGTDYKVKKIAAKAFKGNESVTTVILPKSVKSIGKNAFNGCTNLKTINIKATAVKSINKNAFNGCSAKIKVASAEIKAIVENVYSNNNVKVVK